VAELFLVFDIWEFFGAWSLGFGTWTFGERGAQKISRVTAWTRFIF
jgi:hypothetical protein